MSINKEALSVPRQGGCASKLPSAMIDKLIGAIARPVFEKDFLVGPESRDDAAVYKIHEEIAIISTLDFSSPFCTDPILFGSISAANALSDIYAMGGRPISALSILAAPETCSDNLLLSISQGAGDICSSAGSPIVGGHSAAALELLFGLAVTGVCRPRDIVRNDTASPGDIIFLTKPLGFGIYAHASLRSEEDSTDAWLIGRQLNSVGAELAEANLVNAMTDVSGFGLLGHLLEVALGSKLRARINSNDVPILPSCQRLLAGSDASGASARNFLAIRPFTTFGRAVPKWKRLAMLDSETNGGLLISVPQSKCDDVQRVLYAGGFLNSAIIGQFLSGTPGIEVA